MVSAMAMAVCSGNNLLHFGVSLHEQEQPNCEAGLFSCAYTDKEPSHAPSPHFARISVCNCAHML